MTKKERAIKNGDMVYSLCQANIPINEISKQTGFDEKKIWRLINSKVARLTKVKTKNEPLDLKSGIKEKPHIKNECCSCSYIWFSDSQFESCPECGNNST